VFPLEQQAARQVRQGEAEGVRVLHVRPGANGPAERPAGGRTQRRNSVADVKDGLDRLSGAAAGADVYRRLTGYEKTCGARRLLRAAGLCR
jgi:hypothetical protein